MADEKKVWLITGASSGLGLALAQTVLKRGDRVALLARRADLLNEVVVAFPDHTLALPLDVTSADSPARAVSQTLARFGRIDVLANLAGRGAFGAAEEFSADQLHSVMDLNFFASARMTQAVLPSMRAQGSGRIFQMVGIAGAVAFSGFAPYCASKFALEGWSEALSGEIERFGIRLTLLEAGSFRTDFAGEKKLKSASNIEAYRPVLAPIANYLAAMHGKQPGDPRKAAAAMMALADTERPPLRLMLGADALGLHEKKQRVLQRDSAAWRSTSESTNFD